jgi:4-diphosphocytidyl-2-C-methyl-D-erythritol kinase
MTLTLAAPAKINLWLRIGTRRPSGFHDLDTLFCAIGLEDTVMVEPGPAGSGTRLAVNWEPPLPGPPELGSPERNLVVRAVAAFAHRAGIEPDFRVRLVKRIPPAAGLGGGSSDAAATLLALDRLQPGAVHRGALLDLAASLGSDVPFFLAGDPWARGTGRGTELARVEPLPARPLVLVLPDSGIATADAYHWLAQDRAAGRAAAAAVHPGTDPGSWSELAAMAANDFEAVVFRRRPDLHRIRDALAGHGAAPALLSGSGATLFGVFGSVKDAERAAAAIANQFAAVRTVVTATREA